jgi:hypothetical protein
MTVTCNNNRVDLQLLPSHQPATCTTLLRRPELSKCIILEPTARVFKHHSTFNNIAPTTRSKSLRTELLATFHNPLFDIDTNLFEETSSDQATHNTLSPLHSLLFCLSEFPSPSNSVSENENSQLFVTPPLTPTQTSFTQSQRPLSDTTQSLPIATMATTYTMPMRNECAAPIDSSKPRELSQYFKDLEQLMKRATISDQQDMKKQVLRYVDFGTEQIWKTFPEFLDDNKTYQDFKDAILVHYPDASGDFIYSIRDMDLLIGERQCLGINSTKDLSDYHLQFIAITTWLISKGQLGNLEQQRAYIRAFPSPLLSAIMNRLQLKNADHHPNIPHKVEAVYKAACFVLQGYSSFTHNLIAPNNPSYTLLSQQSPTTGFSPTATTPVKAEDLSTLIAGFTKSIIDALHSTQSQGPPQSQDGKIECNYCGEEHFIHDFPHVKTDIKCGKCRRNQDGKVVLSTGAFVPWDITGKYLRNHINEWHKRHPNQLAAATLIHTIDKCLVEIPQPTPITQANYHLTTNDRIAVLEAELYNLRTRRPVHPQFNRSTHAQKARNTNVDIDDKEAVAVVRAQQSRIKEIPDEDATPLPQDTSKGNPLMLTSTQSQPTDGPEHPYQLAKDAAYSPPVTKNVGAQVKPVASSNKKPEPAYKTLPPIHDPLIAESVYKRSLETPITITQRELLSSSPEV